MTRYCHGISSRLDRGCPSDKARGSTCESNSIEDIDT